MRVLLIDVNCKHSSTGNIVYNLYESLHRNGHEAAICYGRGEKIEEPGIYKFGLDWETRMHAGLARVTGLNGYFSPFSTRRLIKFIEEFDPDVIHIHELHAYFVNIKPLIEYIKRKGIKVVWTFHCEYMYTGKCGHAYGCTNYQTGCGNCPAIKDYPKSLLFDRTRKMLADKKEALEDWDFMIVTPSQWLKDRVMTSFLSGKEIDVIRNGIDTKVFYPRDASDLSSKFGFKDKKVILSVAPNIMDESKGGKKVLEISQLPEMRDYQFVLIGADEDSRPFENVHVLKRTKNQDELAEWYSLADVFLICSKRENFPTTCLEAFCCGTPVVGIDEGGTAETVPAPYGLFVSDDSALALAEAIKAQLEASLNRHGIMKAGKSRHSADGMCDRYIEHYQTII